MEKLLLWLSERQRGREDVVVVQSIKMMVMDRERRTRNHREIGSVGRLFCFMSIRVFLFKFFSWA